MTAAEIERALVALDNLEGAAEHWAGDTCRSDANTVRTVLTRPSISADLAVIKARADAATPGPWQTTPSLGRLASALGRWSVDTLPDVPDEQNISYEVNGHADAEFIAHARTDVPALVAELMAARVELAELALRRVQMQLATRDLENALAAEHDILNGRPILDATEERDTCMRTALAALRGETKS